ncbi:hypothetical protein J4Q44_G00274900 [Coregonus suidteri]|uniref:Uncharacterized protein n=1 Tax=Coregonus suidteri TaxID=861788 RepID=A0AAN8L147_9TELE
MTSWCTLRTDSKLPCRMRWWWVGGPVSPPQEAWTGGGASVPSKTLRRFLQQLEVLFSLSLVPRVLLLLGGSLLPKELYEVNMEEVILSAGDRSLRISFCLRHLFRTVV